MSSWREYPERPIVGIGGVVIEGGRALLIRRGNEPLMGQWSIPGGTLELGETLEEGTARELTEETGLEVKVIEMIEVFERINFGATIGAANHGRILRRNIRGAESRRIATATDHRIIYRE